MERIVISYKNIAGTLFGILAAITAILIVPKFDRPQNDVADLEVSKIRGVWFIPDGKSQDDVLWLGPSNIESLHRCLSSEVIESHPTKLPPVGRVGFTYQSGRTAGVELYDTKTEIGLFRCGNTFFRYEGNVPELIRATNRKSVADHY